MKHFSNSIAFPFLKTIFAPTPTGTYQFKLKTEPLQESNQI